MSGTSGPGERPLVGVSSCLLGERVRYDGNHKRDLFLTDRLGAFVDFEPVCPEVECGLPVPREAMRLVESSGGIRLVTRSTGRDFTQLMLSWARERIAGLAALPLCGFVFKSRSPSSGIRGVKRYTPDGKPAKTGAGLFAGLFKEAFPLLPAEDEGRLRDSGIRENFIERIFVAFRWRELVARGMSRGALVDFHTRHKLLLMAHSPSAQSELGRLVAGTGDVESLYMSYHRTLMGAMALKATAGKNANVLQHMAGFFKKVLGPREKEELSRLISSYRTGLVPLVAPLTLISHHVMLHGPAWLEGQVYLNPHPMELMLRNHV